MKLCPDCGNDCVSYELRRWGRCIDRDWETIVILTISLSIFNPPVQLFH